MRYLRLWQRFCCEFGASGAICPKAIEKCYLILRPSVDENIRFLRNVAIAWSTRCNLPEVFILLRYAFSENMPDGFGADMIQQTDRRDLHLRFSFLPCIEQLPHYYQLLNCPLVCGVCVWHIPIYDVAAQHWDHPFTLSATIQSWYWGPLGAGIAQSV